MPVVCVLYDVLKNNKFPVWHNFVWLPGRQIKKVISLLSAHVQLQQIQSQSMRNCKLIFLFLFCFLFKIQHSIEIKLFLDYKPTYADGWPDRQRQRQRNYCFTTLFASRVLDNYYICHQRKHQASWNVNGLLYSMVKILPDSVA